MLSEPLRKQITDRLARERVVLFMKGSRQMPQCGFSAQVVQILDEHLSSYETVDVLRSAEMREGIKEFTQWPTIPQLFVAGQFIGGCDIVREMKQSGELGKLLGAEAAAPKLPSIRVTPAAVKAFQAALADAGGDVLRFQINAAFQNELFLAPRAPGDVERPRARRRSQPDCRLRDDDRPGDRRRVRRGGARQCSPREPAPDHH